MMIRRAALSAFALSVIATFSPSPVVGQSNPSSSEKTTTQAAARGEAQTASHVSAEMVKGKLNPATSKPGDQVAVRLQEDLKSNGQVILKKGSTINGVVKNVKRAEGKAQSSGEARSQQAAQSMIQVDWLAPAASGSASQSLNFALRSVAYTKPLFAHQAQQESAGADPVSARPVARPAGGGSVAGGGGLVSGVGGVVGGTTSAVGGATSSVGTVTGVAGSATGVAGTASGQAAGQTRSGLLAAPTAVPVTSQTAAAMQNDFGVSRNNLFLTGHGQAVSSGGTSSPIDVYSHMSNDSILTSSSKDFEIGSGAQMQFMVDSRRQQ